MRYKDYTDSCQRLKREQAALDRRFISEYRYRHLFGKTVMVCFRFHGKLRLEKHYFQGLESFCHDISPVFFFLREDGTRSKTRVGYIYSLKFIEEIIPIEEEDNERVNQTGKGNESRTDRICQDQGLAAAAGGESAGNESGQNDSEIGNRSIAL